MVVRNTLPTIDIQAGLAALEQDLPRVLDVFEASSLTDLGWMRPSPLALHIPIKGTFQGKTDQYLLRLGFQAYRLWPPSAQFVNPGTGCYSFPADQVHVPKLTSGECYTHVAYRYDVHGERRQKQLICCSATLEFYEVLHSVEDALVWHGTETFLSTVNAIRKAFTSHYQGRFDEHGR